MNTKFLSAFIFVPAFLFLSACSSQPIKTQYYALDNYKEALTNKNSIANKSVTKQPSIYLHKVTMTDYLKQSGIVMLKNNHQISIANYYLWAESLEQAIPKVLSQDIAQQCECNVYNYVNSEPKNDKMIGIKLNVNQFGVTENGISVFSGHYQISYQNSDREGKFERFHLTMPQKQAGYYESVKNLRSLLKTLANKIQAAI